MISIPLNNNRAKAVFLLIVFNPITVTRMGQQIMQGNSDPLRNNTCKSPELICGCSHENKA